MKTTKQMKLLVFTMVLGLIVSGLTLMPPSAFSGRQIRYMPASRIMPTVPIHGGAGNGNESIAAVDGDSARASGDVDEGMVATDADTHPEEVEKPQENSPPRWVNPRYKDGWSGGGTTVRGSCFKDDGFSHARCG